MSIEVAGSDLEQWIGGCIVTIDDVPDALMLVSRIRGDSGTGLRGTKLVWDAKRARVVCEDLSARAKDVSLWMPLVGSTNICMPSGFRIGAHVTRSTAERRWRRSQHPDLLGADFPRAWDIEKETGGSSFIESRSRHSNAVIMALHADVYPDSVMEAMEWMVKDKKCLSVAVNRSVILYFAGKHRFIVFHKGAQVGVYDSMQNTLDCSKGGSLERRLLKLLDARRA
jgi:hypothetical protein